MSSAPQIPAPVREALRSATAAAELLGEVPIAAVIARGDTILGVGHNRCITDHDPTAHAEIVALRNAGGAGENYRLPDATLYVTVEPCAMCAGAILNARVAHVIYGARDEKSGAAGSVCDLFAVKKINHHVQDVRQDAALATQATRDLQRFFIAKRDQPKIPAFEVGTADWAEDCAALTKIRFDVFVREQGVPAELEVDAFDPTCVHALARMRKDGAPIATGRLLPDGHIGRMAVLKAYRGTGVGMAVLQYLIALAKTRGFASVELSAQTHALDFYARAGFEAYGAVYLDCDIPHRMMRRSI